MNPFKYNSSNAFLKKEIEIALLKLEKEYNSGKILTKSEYIKAINDVINNITNSFGKPNITFNDIKNVPVKKDFVGVCDKTLSSLVKFVDMNSSLSTIFSENKQDILNSLSLINERIYGVLVDIKTFSNKINDIKSNNTITISNAFSFSDNEADDEIKNFDEIASCDLGSKKLTLPIKKRSSTVNDLIVEILDSSNGFPGNTHEVYDLSNNIKFIGESNPRINLLDIDTSDTPYNATSSNEYFEFEMYNLDEEEVFKTGNIGFKYKENVLWVNNDKELKLNLKITAVVPFKTNSLNIIAPIKKNAKTITPIIKRVILIDALAQTEAIVLNTSFEDSILVTFKERDIKSVIIEFVQTESYKTKVCRYYGLLDDYKNISTFISKVDVAKIEQPVHSINLLNLKYDSVKQKIIYPSTKNKDLFLSDEFIKSSLFYMDNYNNLINRDIVSANRFSIAIAGLNLTCKEYNPFGVYISKRHYLEDDIKQIVFSANDFIPIHFKDCKNSIRYFISFDNNEWIRIYPKEKPQYGPCCIEINSETILSNRNNNIIYIESLLSVKSVQVKIELYGEKEEKFVTPYVSSYKINLKVD